MSFLDILYKADGMVRDMKQGNCKVKEEKNTATESLNLPSNKTKQTDYSVYCQKYHRRYRQLSQERLSE